MTATRRQTFTTTRIPEGKGGAVTQGNGAIKGTVRPQAGWTRLALAVLCALCMLLAVPGVAAAKSVYLHTFSSSFNGSDAVGAPAFGSQPGINKIDIDQEKNILYVGTGITGFGSGSGYVYKLSLAGVSQPFLALNPNTVIPQAVGSEGDLEVDNTPIEATHGRIYAFQALEDVLHGGPYNAYFPDGSKITSGLWPARAQGQDGTFCGASVAQNGDIWYMSGFLNAAFLYSPEGEYLQKEVRFTEDEGHCDIETDKQGNFYVPSGAGSTSSEFTRTTKWSEDGEELYVLDPATARSSAVDPSNGHVYVDRGNEIVHYDQNGDLIGSFGKAEGTYPGLSGSTGIAVDEDTHKVYVANNRSGHKEVDVFSPGATITVPGVVGLKPEVGPNGATFHGTVNPDSVATTNCIFEWGTSELNLSHKEECAEGKVFNGGTDQAVSKSISGLSQGQQYFWALRSENANGVPSRTRQFRFYASEKPVIVGETISKVNTDAAQFGLEIDPKGGITRYRIEYGTEEGVYGESAPVPDGTTVSNLAIESFNHLVIGLTPDTEYHYRMVAENDAGPTFGPDRVFRTFPEPPTKDPCPNALVRKQTSAGLLPECRAYELVSAANQGGYDVNSDLIPGDEPLVSAPRAADSFLYSIRFGAIPGIAGSPTTFGHDPYVATRGDNEWTTSFVGLPANGMPSQQPFGSPLAGHDDALSVFAFGGEHICSPCFADGSINMPLRLSDGSLVKGIEGPLGPTQADPAGEVRKRFSADGSHFVFGTTKKLDDAANEGSLTIYKRDLESGDTRVVSILDNGSTMTGSGIAELDISADGSRVLMGKLVGTDAAGNEHFDLYMQVDGSPNAVKVADTPNGVIYNGMTADGSQVYFTTADQVADDADLTSVDLFRAAVGSTSATVTRVSTGTGGTGNTDACTPSGSPSTWNALNGDGKCSVVAFAGGSGVAADNGAVYFLSPETLDGASNGTAGEPNLYLAEVGQAPHFVATVDPGNVGIAHGLQQTETHSFQDFQVTPDGAFAVFNSAEPIGGAVTHGHTAVYRYDSGADKVVCVSCGPSVNPDTSLTPNGLNLTDDGRVFFTTTEQLALRDTNEAVDVYEWKEEGPREVVSLISSGTHPEGSTLATASADGTDAFFFTRDSLAPQDKNGAPVKIYDAREFGGFLYIAPPFPCKASDECHGPGTRAAEPPAINTKDGSGRTSAPKKPKRCKHGFVRRHGKCVKRHRHHRRNRKHR
jgi:hypothetical protein